MAARIRVKHQDEVREKIRASQLVNRLENHVFGGVEMSSTQVTAALGLLKKCVPDLSSTDIDMTANVTNTISADPVSEDDWEKQYSTGVGTTVGSAKSPH